jgi:hypothetical protein
MLTRVLILGAVLLLAGCGGDSAPTTAPAPQAKQKLAPEAEHDPVTATEMYRKNKKHK